MAGIDHYTRDDIVKHYHTYFVPNNATIVVVGDFDSEKLLAQIENTFGKIQRGHDVPIVTAVAPKHIGERRVIVKRRAELPAVFAGYTVPTVKHPDSYALEVLQVILASGKSSRLVVANQGKAKLK